MSTVPTGTQVKGKKGKGKKEAAGAMAAIAAAAEKPEGRPAKGKGAKGKPGRGGPVTALVKAGRPQFSDAQYVRRFAALEERAEAMRKEAMGLRDRVVAVYVEQGALLVEVKEKLGHGSFGKWIEEKLNIKPDWASKLMGIARTFPGGVPKLPDGSDPTVTMLADAARAVKLGETPEKAVRAAAEKAPKKTAKPEKAPKGNGEARAPALPAEVLPPEDAGQTLSDAFYLVGVEGPAAALAQVRLSKDALDALLGAFEVDGWAVAMLRLRVPQ